MRNTNGAVDWEGYLREMRKGQIEDHIKRKAIGIDDWYLIFNPNALNREPEWESRES